MRDGNSKRKNNCIKIETKISTINWISIILVLVLFVYWIWISKFTLVIKIFILSVFFVGLIFFLPYLSENKFIQDRGVCKYIKTKPKTKDGVTLYPDGSKFYYARWGPGFKYRIPKHIENDPDINIIYLE